MCLAPRLACLLLAACSVPTAPAPIPRAPTDRDRGHLDFSVTRGEVQIEPDGGTADDAKATRFKLDGEFTGETLGGGFQLFGSTTDDDMLVANGLGDVALVGLDTIGAFVHFTIKPKLGDVARIPIRIGTRIEFQNESGGLVGVSPNESELDYFHFGTQLEVMPEVHFVRTNGVTLSAYGGGQLGVATTIVRAQIDSSSGFIDDTSDDAGAWFGGVELGVRLTAAKFRGQIGYVYSRTEIDSAGFDFPNQRLPGRTYEFQGILFSAGVQF